MVEINLSASRISTYQSCSWQYWCQYVLKIRSPANDGSRRGVMVHAVLEAISVPKRKERLKRYVQDFDNLRTDKSIRRYLRMMAKREQLKTTEENASLIWDMLEVALKQDCFQKEWEIVGIEKNFNLNGVSPRYKALGFIDRAHKTEEKTLHIIDWKTSKVKKSAKEIEFDVQAYMYILAAKDIWKDLDIDKVILDFVFLRFPKKPIQRVELTKEQLRGFEYYLEYVQNQMMTINEAKACCGLAVKDKDKSWLCGRGSYECAFKKPFKYWSIVDPKTKETVASAFTLLELASKIKEGQEIEERQYTGCKAWN